MSFNVTLAVEFEDASESQIRTFEQELMRRSWVRYGKESIYCTTIVGEVSDSQILESSQDDMKAAAELAGLESWNGVCLIADSTDECSEDDDEFVEHHNEYPEEATIGTTRTMVAVS